MMTTLKKIVIIYYLERMQFFVSIHLSSFNSFVRFIFLLFSLKKRQLQIQNPIKREFTLLEERLNTIIQMNHEKNTSTIQKPHTKRTDSKDSHRVVVSWL